jgi:hypothetical protein
MECRFVGAAIEGGDLDQYVFDVCFGVLDENVEVAIFGEDARVDQLVLGLPSPSTPVFRDKLRLRKLGSRIFVQHLHIGMRRRGVEIEVVLLHILAVIPFVSVESEEALLENWIAAIPECQTEADKLMAIADSGDAILSPAISPRARMVVWEIFPGGAARAVVFANSSPLPLGQIRTPALPIFFPGARLVEPPIFHCR